MPPDGLHRRRRARPEGQTLVAGLYNNSAAGTLGLTGTVTLDAQGDPNAVFIFQAESTLITSSGSTVALINGASSCNVYWQVGSPATLGTNSTFVGTVMALTSISASTGATIQGRLLARNAAVDSRHQHDQLDGVRHRANRPPDDHRTTHHRRTAPHRIADDRTRWRQHGSGPPDPRPSGRRARSSVTGSRTIVAFMMDVRGCARRSVAALRPPRPATTRRSVAGAQSA